MRWLKCRSCCSLTSDHRCGTAEEGPPFGRDATYGEALSSSSLKKDMSSLSTETPAMLRRNPELGKAKKTQDHALNDYIKSVYSKTYGPSLLFA